MRLRYDDPFENEVIADKLRRVLDERGQLSSLEQRSSYRFDKSKAFNLKCKGFNLLEFIYERVMCDGLIRFLSRRIESVPPSGRQLSDGVINGGVARGGAALQGQVFTPNPGDALNQGISPIGDFLDELLDLDAPCARQTYETIANLPVVTEQNTHYFVSDKTGPAVNSVTASNVELHCRWSNTRC